MKKDRPKEKLDEMTLHQCIRWYMDGWTFVIAAGRIRAARKEMRR